MPFTGWWRWQMRRLHVGSGWSCTRLFPGKRQQVRSGAEDTRLAHQPGRAPTGTPTSALSVTARSRRLSACVRVSSLETPRSRRSVTSRIRRPLGTNHSAVGRPTQQTRTQPSSAGSPHTFPSESTYSHVALTASGLRMGARGGGSVRQGGLGEGVTGQPRTMTSRPGIASGLAHRGYSRPTPLRPAGSAAHAGHGQPSRPRPHTGRIRARRAAKTQLHAPGSSGSRLRGAVGRGWGGLRRRALLPGTGEPRAGRARTAGPAGAQKP